MFCSNVSALDVLSASNNSHCESNTGRRCRDRDLRECNGPKGEPGVCLLDWLGQSAHFPTESLCSVADTIQRSLKWVEGRELRRFRSTIVVYDLFYWTPLPPTTDTLWVFRLFQDTERNLLLAFQFVLVSVSRDIHGVAVRLKPHDALVIASAL